MSVMSSILLNNVLIKGWLFVIDPTSLLKDKMNILYVYGLVYVVFGLLKDNSY